MNLSRVYIITGEQGAGKTSFLSAFVELLKNNEITLGGILARGEWENDKRTKFLMEDLSSGHLMPLASLEKCKNWYSLGRFFFNPASVSYGNALMQSDEIQENDIIILDEIGPFELQGEVWANGLRKIRNTYSGILIISVRQTLVREVCRHWNLQNPVIIDVTREKADQLVQRVKNNLLNQG